MTRAFLPPIAVLALVACSAEPSRPAAEDIPAAATSAPAAPATASEPVATPEDLWGEWRVGGIDGGEVAGNMGIGVSIEGSTLSYEPRCLGFVWTLRLGAAGQVALARDPRSGPQRQPDGSVLSCAVAVTPAFYRVGEALDRAERASQLPSGGVEFAGGGRSVILFRQ